MLLWVVMAVPVKAVLSEFCGLVDCRGPRRKETRGDGRGGREGEEVGEGRLAELRGRAYPVVLLPSFQC